MKNLNAREKVLLIVAALALVGYLSFTFVIKPIWTERSENTTKRDSLTAQKTLLDQKLSLEGITNITNENARIAYEEAREQYPLQVPNEEVDRLLTSLCVENGFNPISLGMSTANPLTITMAEPEDEPENTDSENTSAADTAPEEEAEETAQEPVLVMVTASMGLEGDYDSLCRLVDSVEAIEYIRIARLSFADFAGSAGNITVFFEVVMRIEE